MQMKTVGQQSKFAKISYVNWAIVLFFFISSLIFSVFIFWFCFASFLGLFVKSLAQKRNYYKMRAYCILTQIKKCSSSLRGRAANVHAME